MRSIILLVSTAIFLTSCTSGEDAAVSRKDQMISQLSPFVTDPGILDYLAEEASLARVSSIQRVDSARISRN